MSALAFNTRRPIFEDARVRRAFILLFDAEWINRSLFNGAYKRTQSFFERSDALLARPAGRCARAGAAGPIRPIRQARGARRHLRLPVTDGSGDNRANLQAAFQLLTEAGYEPKGGRLVKDGVPSRFEFLAQTRQQERLMLSYARTLERLGIAAAHPPGRFARNTGPASRPSTST